MTSALWRHTGAIWPIGVSCSLTWLDLGAIAHIIQTAHIRTVLEAGLVYRGIDITLNALNTAVRARDLSAIDERDAWDDRTIAEMRDWLATQPAPCLIICDGGDKPKELHLYAPLIRPGDVLLGHDFHNEYVEAAIADMPLERMCADWLDDTMLCAFHA
jgi:hypothetical protein